MSAPKDTETGGTGSRRVPQTGPAVALHPKRAGGYTFIESDYDSDSDTNVFRHGGGAKLNQSPYRPPHARQSKERLALEKGKGLVTPDSTDSELATAAGQLTFQQGEPSDSGDDVFDAGSSASTSDNGVTHGKKVAAAKQEPTKSGPLTSTEVNAVLAYAAGRTPKTPTELSGLRRRHVPTSDRHLVGDLDAQHVYPHTACVFIANLPQDKSDDALEAEITEKFSEFGTVFIKIKRDRDGMPYGFLQYTNDEDAAMAIQHGRGMLIFQRSCRLEGAKGLRTFIVFRHDLSNIMVTEATQAVAAYGVVSRAYHLAAELSDKLGARHAVYVEFREFDHARQREIVHHFRNHPTYRVKTYDETKIPDESTPVTDQQYLHEYRTSRNCIHVTGYPHNTTKEEIHSYFQRDLNMVVKNVDMPAYKNYAFVEFDRPDMPDDAIKGSRDVLFKNSKLVVQRRNPPRPRKVKSMRSGNMRATPGRAIVRAGTLSGNRGDFLGHRRAFSAHPAGLLAAQADMGSHAMITGPTPPIVVSPAPNASAGADISEHTMTAPGGSNMGGFQLSALAPPFGMPDYNMPTPGLMAPALMTPVAGPQFFGNQFGFGNQQFGGFGMQQFGGFGMQPAFQQPAFFGAGGQFGLSGVINGQTYYQDARTGMMFGMTAVPTPATGVQAPGVAQRSASMMPEIPDSERIQRASDNSLRPKKSVSFADPLEETDAGSPARQTDSPQRTDAEAAESTEDTEAV